MVIQWVEPQILLNNAQDSLYNNYPTKNTSTAPQLRQSHLS